MQASLSTPLNGKLHDEIALELTNISDSTREVWLDLGAGGLANIETARRYEARLLAAGESTIMRVAASELPLQASHLPVSTVITVGYSQGDGRPGRVVIGDVLTQSSADLSRVAVWPSDSDASFELDDAARGSMAGRRFDPTKNEFIELDSSALALNPSANVVGQGFALVAEDSLEEGVEVASEGATNKAAFTRFCASVRYSYSDSGFGEDRLASVPSGVIAAAYARYNVQLGSASPRAGYLDANGCTPSLDTPAGRYTFKIFSRALRSSKEIKMYHSRANEVLGSASVAIDVNSQTNGTISVTPPLTTEYADFLALAVTSLSVIPEAHFGTTKFYLTDECSLGRGACASGTTISVGTDTQGNSLARSKFVLLHELGHVVQRTNFGFPARGPDTGFETAPLCNCDHVPLRPGETDATTVIRKHCMQSREGAEYAQVEGFGHYFAARVLNVANVGSNCNFAYYKHFKHPNGVVQASPMWIDCKWTYAWNTHQCGADPHWPNTGVELDWLSFYWNLTTRDASFDFATLRLLHIKACNPSCSGDATCFTACTGKPLNGGSLEEAAAVTWGFGSWQHLTVQELVWEHLL